MFRFILSFFGGIFTTVTMGAMMIALSIGAVFWMYGRDLPSHESLAQYQPATISRIYSGEGQIIDVERGERGFGYDSLFVPDAGDGRTFGEHDPAEKNAMSHRSNACQGLLAQLN